MLHKRLKSGALLLSLNLFANLDPSSQILATSMHTLKELPSYEKSDHHSHEPQVPTSPLKALNYLSLSKEHTDHVLKARTLAEKAYGLHFKDVDMGDKSKLEIIHGLTHIQESTPVGTVQYDPELNAIFVSFVGTSNMDQVLTDIRGNSVDSSLQGLIHHGFHIYHQHYQAALYDSLMNLLSQHQDAELYFTGHSLGGAQAYIAAAHFKNAHPELEENQVKVVTFSAPLVGDEKLNDSANALLGDNIVNFACRADAVTFAKVPGSSHVPFGKQIAYSYDQKAFSDALPAGSALYNQYGDNYLVSGAAKLGIAALKAVSAYRSSNKKDAALILADTAQQAHAIPVEEFVKQLFIKAA